MNKVSLLTASITLALAGCGGSDDDSSSSNSGVTITGFDGYFENAVVFIDDNNNGAWDISEKALGLTDKKGQLNVGTTKPDGILALQVLNGDGTFNSHLAANELTTNLFTVDSDFPGQPVEHNLVFRSPNSSDVISPITDLVAIEMANNGALSEDEAITEVSKALNGGVEDDNFNPYTDFVSGNDADSSLHKKAQILTASKAQNESAYNTGTKAKEIADEAKQVVDTLTEDQLKDPSFVTPVDGDTSVIEVPTYKTTVNAEVYEQIQESLDNLELELGTLGSPDYFLKIDLSKLFNDKDTNIESGLIKIDSSSLVGSNIEAVYHYNETFELNIGVSPTKSIAKAGEFKINVFVGNSTHTNSTRAIFTLNVDKGEAIEPEVKGDLELLQSKIASWSLTAGTEITAQDAFTISYSDLFDGNNLEIIGSSSLESNGLSLTKDENNQEFLLTGTPQKSSADFGIDFKIWITATDTINGLSKKITLDVPEIKEKQLNPLEEKDLFFIETPDWDSSETLSHCVSFRLEDGNFYLGDENYSASLTSSCAPVSSASSGTYTIDGDIITILENGEDPMTLEIKHTSEQGESTRFMVQSIEQRTNSDNYISMFEAINDRQETENRINQSSIDDWDDLSQVTTLKIYDDFVELHITAQMKNEDDTGTGIADADLYFENMNGDITCDDLQASFDGFSFGDVSSYECYDKEDTLNGVTRKYATYDFDFNEHFANPSTHRVYMIGLTDADPTFNMNITFDGDSSYE
ncbi:acid phosphatase [Vibrio scophthalmi]|uniref:Uncharacterized protein n=1 Tax=Vibrio scophthalmi TaxID=45658 RepID=A0A1B1NJR5_9VIBR|nr:hypothetical protein [Vibrio scophthalmi]ANS83923.1 hypothetical protein VSVS12_00082 [Vibrio scophthalmi]ANU37953.1 hypothetical protein VSVS05_02899 [Vibrio scophthalmi]